MSESLSHAELVAALDWQCELGATEAIGDLPVNRYEIPAEAPKPKAAAPLAIVKPEAVDPVAVAKEIVSEVTDLAGLAAALNAFDLCDFKRGARSFVFSDGQPSARVMVIGGTPARDEDLEGKPYIGAEGQLLDRMFAAIGLGRGEQDAIYVTKVFPWRPLQDREPNAAEIAMLRPFVEKHIELAQPEVIVLMGNTACQTVLDRKGLTRMRGQWAEAFGRPVLPMYHPGHLLKNPLLKREAWHDLLMLQDRLRQK